MALARAIMLRRRSRANARYSREYEILAYAEREPSSWPAIVRAKEEVLAIPPFVVQASVQSSIRLRAQLWYHARTVVVPLVRAHEMRTWHESSKNCANWGNCSPMNWTISQLLKLQGYFTNGSRMALPACRLCGRDEAETVHHLLFQCDDAMQFFARVPAWRDKHTRLAVGNSLSEARDVLPWLEAAGKLHRHVQKLAVPSL